LSQITIQSFSFSALKNKLILKYFTIDDGTAQGQIKRLMCFLIFFR